MTRPECRYIREHAAECALDRLEACYPTGIDPNQQCSLVRRMMAKRAARAQRDPKDDGANGAVFAVISRMRRLDRAGELTAEAWERTRAEVVPMISALAVETGRERRARR